MLYSLRSLPSALSHLPNLSPSHLQFYSPIPQSFRIPHSTFHIQAPLILLFFRLPALRAVGSGLYEPEAGA
jgi:hypothetical protein